MVVCVGGGGGGGGGGGLKTMVIYVFIPSSSRFYPSLTGLAMHAGEECRAEMTLSLQVLSDVAV